MMLGPVGEEPRMIAADISFWTFLWYAFAGLVIGLIARAIMPGRQHMNIFVTIDNFEGIAARQMPDGSVRLYVISDDNFSIIQRTLLLQFMLAE